MITPVKSVSLNRLRTAYDYNQMGLVKIVHQPTGKFYLAKGKMYETAQVEMTLLYDKRHSNKRLQRAFDAEADFYFEFYPTTSVGRVRKELLEGVSSHLIL